VRARERVWSAAGDAEDAEPINAEMRRDREHVAGPVGEAPVRIERGVAVAGAVRGDQPIAGR
jgi:hypothetical protein